MNKPSAERWEKEYREFLDPPESSVPGQLSGDLIGRITSELNPSPWYVFARLTIITAISSLLSLAACPQFGFGNNFGLMRFFMQFGPVVCSLGCGAVFLSVGLALAGFLLRPEEINVLRRTKFLQLSLLSAMSLGGFTCFGEAVVLSVGVLWMLGAIIGGLIALELTYQLKVAAARA